MRGGVPPSGLVTVVIGGARALAFFAEAVDRCADVGHGRDGHDPAVPVRGARGRVGGDVRHGSVELGIGRPWGWGAWPAGGGEGGQAVGAGGVDDVVQPGAQVARERARAGVARVWGDFTIARAEEPGAPDLTATGTVFAMIVQGTKHLEFGEHSYDYGVGEYLVASVDMPVTGYFSEATPEYPALGFGLALRPALIAELLMLPAAAGLPHTGRGVEPGLSVGRLTPQLADAATRLLRLVDHPRDLAVLAPLIEREFLWLLISGEHGAAIKQLGLADSRMSRIRHAIQWIREHYAEQLRIDDLARMTAMSVSSFHRSFAAVTMTSPLQFQKQIRLQEARARLVATPGDVAGTAYAVGYESPSQFSREYRRQFGLPPTQDALRVRTNAPARTA